MTKDTLTICSVVYNDKKSNLFDLTVKSILKYTDPLPNFIICDNGNNDLEKYKSLSNFTIIENKTSSIGSLAHGEGLNKIFPLVNTKRTAIIESDCVILSNDWDKIEFPKYKMLAARKETGVAGPPIYHMCFMVFSTSLLRHNGIIDFRPGLSGNRTNRTYKSHEDVGHMINSKLDASQVQLLEFVDCKTNVGKIFNDQFQSDEFWLKGKPLVAHFGRGSNIGGKAVRKNFKSHKEQLVEWKKIVEDLLK